MKLTLYLGVCSIFTIIKDNYGDVPFHPHSAGSPLMSETEQLWACLAFGKEKEFS